MKNQYLIIIIVDAAILVLVGVGVLLYGLSQSDSITGPDPEIGPASDPQTFEIPDTKVTPPPSLAEIAAEVRPEFPELADLLENPELGSAYKDFYLAYQRGGPQTALALARQRGMLNDADEIVMTLVLDTENSAALIAELAAEGVTVSESFGNLVNIAIPISLVEAQIQSESPELIVDRITNLEHVIRVQLPHKATIKQTGVQGQGVNVTFADGWHAQGITGKGVKVGILDLGFAGYQGLLGQELPATVTVEMFGDDSYFASEVHGTAVAEIVHEMAPDAELYLAYYDGSDAAMGRAVTWLLDQDVDIISNSTGSNGLSPMNGTGFAAELVDQVRDAGIFWVNAAGNEATNHYRGAYRDSDGDNFHEFLPDTPGLPFVPFGPGFQTTIVLSWDDWLNVDQDYELILYDSEGTALAKSEDAQSGQPGEMPAEGLVYEFEDTEIYLLSIENYDGQARGDAIFDLFIHEGEMHPDFMVAEASLSSPSDARGAFAVGAVNWADDVLEAYSSQGPTADGRIKPDLAAPSVVDTASYAPEAFDGTSAAAPHVSGAAALILQAQPGSSPDEIATLLQERALDLGPPGPDNGFGVGRLSLGAAPNNPGTLVETPRTQPTSTGRPPEAAVGLPGQSGNGTGRARAQDDGGDLASLLILLGLCFVCLGAMLFVGVLVVGLFVMRRN
jgi:subtilisin family serine protease